jgi:hypothetical protein
MPISRYNVTWGLVLFAVSIGLAPGLGVVTVAQEAQLPAPTASSGQATISSILVYAQKPDPTHPEALVAFTVQIQGDSFGSPTLHNLGLVLFPSSGTSNAIIVAESDDKKTLFGQFSASPTYTLLQVAITGLDSTPIVYDGGGSAPSSSCD